MEHTPLSRITSDKLAYARIHCPVRFTKFLARKGIWLPAEHRLTSGANNRVAFYSLPTLRELLLTQDIRVLKRWRELSLEKEKPKPAMRVKGKYATHTKNSDNRFTTTWTPFTGTLLDKWIHTDRTGKRKLASGANIEWEPIYAKAKPDQTTEQLPPLDPETLPDADESERSQFVTRFPDDL